MSEDRVEIAWIARQPRHLAPGCQHLDSAKETQVDTLQWLAVASGPRVISFTWVEEISSCSDIQMNKSFTMVWNVVSSRSASTGHWRPPVPRESCRDGRRTSPYEVLVGLREVTHFSQVQHGQLIVLQDNLGTDKSFS